jgi:hypothetical protein
LAPYFVAGMSTTDLQENQAGKYIPLHKKHETNSLLIQWPFLLCINTLKELVCLTD